MEPQSFKIYDVNINNKNKLNCVEKVINKKIMNLK